MSTSAARTAKLLKSFNQKICVVIVGISGGIGLAVAKQLLASDQVDLLFGLSRRHVLINDDRYRHIPMDYADEGSIFNAAQQLPDVVDLVLVATGLLHNTKGVKPERTYRHIEVQNLQQVMLVNVIGPSLIAKYLLPRMKATHKTVFSALSARVGSISDNRLGGWYAYRSAKAALNMQIKTFSIELHRCQPQTMIVGLHPGTVDTDLSKPFQRNVAQDKLFTAEFASSCLLSVIDGLSPEDSGACFAWDGKKIPE